MTACKNCGADAPGIACEFCGAIQRQPQTTEDQFEALAALNTAAQRIATETKAFNVHDNEYAATQKLAVFWQQAWMPNAADALAQATSAALSVQPATHHGVTGVRFQEVALRLEDTLLRRAASALDALELSAPSDARLPVLRRRVQERRTGYKELMEQWQKDAKLSVKAQWSRIVYMVLFLAAAAVGAAILNR